MSWRVGVCLVVAIAVCATADPCPYKECDCSRNFINCHNKRLTSWPMMQPGNWAQNDLDMGGNNMATIDQNQIPVSLEYITIQNTPLISIRDVDHLYNLKSLFLQNTKLRYAGLGIGKMPDSLRELHIRFSEVNQIPLKLIGADNLEVLDLDGNQISENIGDGLIFMSSLRELSLLYNKIKVVEHMNFKDGKSSLERLDLSNNPIERIDVGAFDQCTQLKELNLAAIKVTRLPVALADLNSLSTLKLSAVTMSCSCNEAVLGPWASSRPALQVTGQCSGVEIYDFLSHASSCPSQVVG